MKILLDEGSKTTPLSLMHEGRAWHSLYNYAIQDRDTVKLMPGIYSLFSALEMYLKAYIVLKNSDYSEPNNLKKLGHNFNLMRERMIELAPAELREQIKKELDRYKLTSLDINKLKYPEIRRFWHVDYGLEKGEHTLGQIFATIEHEVEAGMDDWMASVYPKTSHIGILLHGESRSSVTREQAEEWLALCPPCRPEDVSVSLQLSYPWCLEDQPYQFCTKCNAPYRPDRFSL